MPPIVVNNVVRYAVRGTIHDRPWANIWDIQISEGRPAAESKIAQTAEELLDLYAVQWASNLGSAWYVVDVTWVDLDSLGGGTGTVNDTPTRTFPFQGVVGMDTAPGNVAVLLQKQTVGGRGARNGRTFLPGLAESDMTGNKLSASKRTNFNNACTAFRNALEASLGGIERTVGVVSQPAGLNPQFNAITALSTAERLATLRRRLRA